MGVLNKEDREFLAEKFGNDLINPVQIGLVVSDNCQYCDLMDRLLNELAEIAGGKILLKKAEINPYLTKILGVNRGPVILIGQKGEVRYTGTPLGEEAWAFIETITIASNGKHGLNDYVEDLRSLDKTVRIETIITLSCPYCPHSVLMANRIALASGGQVISDTIEAYEFPEIANKWAVTAVPTTILSVEEPYSGDVFTIGVPNEKALIRAILKLGIRD